MERRRRPRLVRNIFMRKWKTRSRRVRKLEVTRRAAGGSRTRPYDGIAACAAQTQKKGSAPAFETSGET
jgi:hypothetical protein